MLSAGIVGLPNVGKSTLFNSLVLGGKAQAENYPFCTIEPNKGVVPLPDPRLQELSHISGSKKIVPAFVELVDIAGLVRGASKGEGLGNQFLGNIRQCDAVIHVARCFENEDIHHVDGTIDPVRDLEAIHTELILADLASLEKQCKKLDKSARSGDAEAKATHSLAMRLLQLLDQGRPASSLEISVAEAPLLKSLSLLSSKPALYACNVLEEDFAACAADIMASPMTKAVAEFARDQIVAQSVVVSAAVESELAELDPEEGAEYLRELGVQESGGARLARAVYKLLGLRSYLTTGEQETRAWTIRGGALAPEAAGVIHGDFERGFIAAQVISYDELLECGSLMKAKESGKLRTEGKEYEVLDGDVVEFRFNV